MQPQTPYLDALRAYAARSPGRLHVPGHKGGAAADPVLAEAFGERALELDIPALTEGIDAGPEPTPFQRAQELAAQAWGAARTWFLINGASQGNHAACVALAQGGEQVVVQRNVHSSTIDGLVVSGLRPVFVAPEIDPELGIAHCVTPEALDRALAGVARGRRSDGRVAHLLRRGGRRAGACGGGARARRAAGRGRGLGRPSRVRPVAARHALACGADLVVSSTHKIIGSFTQSAMLHLGAGGRLDEHVVDRAITLLESTSPSSLLCGSLDAARGVRGRERRRLLEETVRALAAARQAIAQHPGPRRAGRAVWPSGRACTPTTRCDSSSTCGARA